MSGYYDFSMNVPPTEQYDPNFPIYDQNYGNFQRISGPPTPHEGYAFWYRPEEATYQRDPSMFPPPLPPMQTSQLTMTEQSQTKHRRTRSGCFTCRSRRVKVC